MTATTAARVALVVALSGLALAAGGATASGSTNGETTPDVEVTGPLTIGSLEFGSSKVMAELYVRALREAGIAAQLSIPSTTAVLVPAMEAGGVDVMPAYVGLFADDLYVEENGEGAVRPATPDLAATLEAAGELAERRGLRLLDATPAAETVAFAVSTEFSDANGITTLSQLAEWSKANPLRMGGEVLCETQPACMPRLQDVYGMVVKEYVPLSADGTVVRGSLVEGGIELGYLVGSDKEADNPDLVVLEQDTPAGTVGNVVPVIRADVASPEVVAALNEVSALVTDEALEEMVSAVQSDGVAIARVTGDFVSASGIGEGLYTGPTKVVSVVVPQPQTAPPAGAPDAGPLRIAYEPLADTALAARVYAGALTSAGVDVVLDDPLEPDDILAALPSGDVQFAPMRLNTIVNTMNREANGELVLPIESRNVLKLVSQARDLGGVRGITVLKASTANVLSAWSVNNNFVANTGIRTLSELSRVSQNRPIVVAGPPDCADEPWCAAFLEERYGIKIAQFVPLDYGGGLTRAAIDTGAVDVGWLSGSDGGIEEFGFQVLTDDLGRGSANPITPVLTTASVTPRIRGILDRVSTVLSNSDLMEMNYAIEFERKDVTEVVFDFLRAHDLA